jgi:VWFA-related protein
LTVFETGTYTQLMKHRRFSGLLLLLAAFDIAATSRAVAQTPQRSMYVSVVNDAGAPVPDLGTSDFIVREDNVAREVLRVAPASEPMQIAVLVDTSQTARNDITHMRQGLPAFVAALTNPDERGTKNDVAIIAFGERPTIFTDYTTDAAALTKGINRIWATPGSGAYFVDAVLEVTQGFKKREAQRPVIVAIVAEGEELSYKRYDQVLEPLRDSGAALYVLMLGSPASDISDEGRSRSIVTEQGTASTGGHRDQLLTSMALPDRLKQLANQLTHQYRVTYARPESLIPPEKITIAAARAGLTARGTPIKEQQVRK